MKSIVLILVTALGLAMSTAGCGKKDRSGIDTSKLEQAFASADPETQNSVYEAIASVDQKDYATALTQFQQLAARPNLTPAQQQVLKDTVARLQKLVADTASAAVDGAAKALDDVKESLPK
jgi:outer membrane protein assembly factor BamD (BamD/ComL family)